MKVCTKCGVEKPATAEFYPTVKRVRLRTICRDCTRAYDREWKKRAYSKNPEHFSAAKRNARAELSETAKAEHLASRRARYASNVDVERERARTRQKKRREDRPESIRKYERDRSKRLKASEPMFALKLRIRQLIAASTRAKGYTKRSRTHEILGCDYETLAAHLEAQFQQGMTWENRGEWHVDHKVPLATAKTEEDVIRLNHYTNLQPLWAADNLAKGARLDWAPQPTGEKK